MPIDEERTLWMERLKEIEEENIRLKIALSGLVRKGMRSGILDKVEAFQNRFLGIDSAVSNIRLKISMQQIITGQGLQYRNLNILLEARHGKLKADIQEIETLFKMLKTEFYEFQKNAVGIS